MSFSHPQYAERLARAAKDEMFSLEAHVRSPRRLDVARTAVVKSEAKLHVPQLKLSDYIEHEVSLPPAVHRHTTDTASLRDVLGNDQWGDCGEAMAIHGIEAFHLDAGTFAPPFQVADALTLYGAVSGFDPNQGPPGRNPTDTGTDNGKLVACWESPGIECANEFGSPHKIVGSLAVDLGDDYLSRLAIWEFVVLFRAVGLPVSAQGKTTWRHVTGSSLGGDDAPGSWGYHDIPYLSYDQHYFDADSWGEDILIGRGWDHAYAAGGFIVITPEQTNLQGISPAGVNWTRLNSDFRSLPQQPVQ